MIKTQEITVNMGPQHPSTHGVFRFILKVDGEIIKEAQSVVGYLHRGIEKLAEDRTYTQFIPYTDRLDYLAGMLNNLGYVQTVEKLMEIEVPERAEYIRVITAELSRIASHMVAIASWILDLGGFTGFMYPFRDREKIFDLFEMLCGSRMTYSYMRIGGVSQDLPDEFLPALKKLLKEFPAMFREYDDLITGNEIFQSRTKGIGILPAEKAIEWGITGPILRASGVPYDLRKVRPYGIYDRFDFEVPVGTTGDNFDRWLMRGAEMRQAVRIIEQAVEGLPEGPIMAKVPKVIKPPVGDAYHEIEGAKGIVGYYVVSDGSPKPYRIHVRRPSFINLGNISEMVKGWKIADLVAIFASYDIVLGEVDC
ncbi:NADH-quinone oxidoreductase subunit D [Candidatus Formimonas warabiya]|uniref:NADH-quinone oxidoreductase subunit D n=1 Tax=Formimonas warabiya TaxID=1761012 RepID=A0A3G1KZS7_FORW1|nr:NADH-quinone oxidoreductase subunit D [Candidatus Formimonas warabiya]ATW28032.1 NADH dehydrogenase [Candidatus Formimonas warabiya]